MPVLGFRSEFSTIVSCSNSFVEIPHAQALQQDPSAFWRGRMIDGSCCVLTVRVDTSWYTVSCTRSVHFSASLVELALKSFKVGNVGAFKRSTKLVNASAVLTRSLPGPYSVFSLNCRGRVYSFSGISLNCHTF